jgi:hypothetical protein
VATLIGVLLRSLFQRHIRSLTSREMMVCTGKAHTGEFWSVWQNPARTERAATTRAISVEHEVPWCDLLWKGEFSARHLASGLKLRFR